MSLCIGMMCHSLSRSGHAAVNKLAENLYTDWLAVLESGVSYCTSREYNTRARHTGPSSTVGNVSGNRCESDCRRRGPEFNPGPVAYFRGD